MNKLALEGLRANHEDLLAVVTSLTPQEWAAPSGCAGWRVQDVLAHQSSIFKLMVDPDPPTADAATPEGAEDMAEAFVAPRKSWTPESVLAEYERYCDPLIEAQAALQSEPMASTEVPLGELGTHPMRLFAGMFSFDAYCHLRFDIVRPGGPIERELPAPDDTRLLAGVEWMMFGLPQMCEEPINAALSAPVAFVFGGPGASSYLLSPSGQGHASVEEVSDAAGAAATVTSSAHDFVSWGTTRSSWRDSCTISGDEALAAAVLDATNVI